MSIGGLRQRLENLAGVSGIHLELTETGLSGIRVTLEDEADEAEVLERIRSLLVTYGLRSPTPVSTLSEPEIVDIRTRSTVTTSIAPDGEGMRVDVSDGEHNVTRVVEATPLAAAQAVAEGRAELSGREPPSVLWVGLDRVGEWRILTVLMRREGQLPTVGASLVTSGWATALDEAVAVASG
jgi:hypothetical protein